MMYGFDPKPVYSEELTLEQAQRWYGHLVPWVLDKNDLKGIIKIRKGIAEGKYKESNAPFSKELWKRAEPSGFDATEVDIY